MQRSQNFLLNICKSVIKDCYLKIRGQSGRFHEKSDVLRKKFEWVVKIWQFSKILPSRQLG